MLVAVLAVLLLVGDKERPREVLSDGEGFGQGEVIDLDADGPFPFSPGLYVLEVESGAVWRVLDQPGFDASNGASYEWSADGEWLVSGSVGTRGKVVSVSRDGRQRRETSGQAWNVARVADGSFLLHLAPDPRDADRPETLGRLDLASMRIEDLGQSVLVPAAAPDGRRALDQANDGQVDVIDLATGQREPVLPGRDSLYIPSQRGSIWSPDSEHVVVADYGDASVLLVVEVGRDRPRVEIATDAGDSAWSPDGSRLAYVVYENYEESIWPDTYLEVRRADAKEPAKRLGRGTSPAWSPDGSALAFEREGALWRIDLASGKEQRLVSAALPVLDEPRWSPGGRFIAFRARSSGGEILMIDTDGRNERVIGDGIEPRWSPDGARIAFFYGMIAWSNTGGLGVMATDGSGVTNLGRVFYSDSLPLCNGEEFAWSPDGSRIAIWSDGSGEGTLSVVASDGASPPLRAAEGQGPSWSPDSRRLVYAAPGGDFSCGLYTVRADGGPPELLVRGALRPAWSPDGRWIAYEPDQRAGASAITLVSPDDPLTRRTLGAGSSAHWSSDSRLVAYYRSGRTSRLGGLLPPGMSDNGTIVVQPIDGGARVEIAVDGYLGAFAFSPDGEQITFAASIDGASQIFVVDLDDPVNLRPLAQGWLPSWSPDGKTILFSRYSFD